MNLKTRKAEVRRVVELLSKLSKECLIPIYFKAGVIDDPSLEETSATWSTLEDEGLLLSASTKVKESWQHLANSRQSVSSTQSFEHTPAGNSYYVFGVGDQGLIVTVFSASEAHSKLFALFGAYALQSPIALLKAISLTESPNEKPEEGVKRDSLVVQTANPVQLLTFVRMSYPSVSVRRWQNNEGGLVANSMMLNQKGGTIFLEVHPT